VHEQLELMVSLREMSSALALRNCWPGFGST
jgi:hypothetical protein